LLRCAISIICYVVSCLRNHTSVCAINLVPLAHYLCLHTAPRCLYSVPPFRALNVHNLSTTVLIKTSPAPPTRPLPIRLPPARTHARAPFPQTSRIQYHIILLRPPFRTHSRIAQVSPPTLRRFPHINAQLYRYLHASTQYYNASPYLTEANFPANNTTAELVAGLAAAHRAYNVQG